MYHKTRIIIEIVDDINITYDDIADLLTPSGGHTVTAKGRDDDDLPRGTPIHIPEDGHMAAIKTALCAGKVTIEQSPWEQDSTLIGKSCKIMGGAREYEYDRFKGCVGVIRSEPAKYPGYYTVALLKWSDGQSTPLHTIEVRKQGFTIID
jgi:hypothetical protein